jgi:hypothetical protein
VKGLEAGECLVKLTREERELLHHILAMARERPDVFGAEEGGDRRAFSYFNMVVNRIQKKLPPRGSGTY